MNQSNYYAVNNSIIEEEKFKSKNNSMIVDDKSMNSDYNNSKILEKKDLNGSFNYSNTSPRSLYSKMKKSVQNMKRDMNAVNGMLNKSQNLSDNNSM